MSWILAILVVLVLIALIGLFILNAYLIRRDMKKRFDGFRARLENEANALLGHILPPDHSEPVDGGNPPTINR
jgi:hypothetical protein